MCGRIDTRDERSALALTFVFVSTLPKQRFAINTTEREKVTDLNASNDRDKEHEPRQQLYREGATNATSSSRYQGDYKKP